MINNLRTFWDTLDGPGRTQLVFLTATPALVLGLGSLNGVHLTDITLTSIMTLFVCGVWSACIAANKREMRAAESRTAMRNEMDRQIAALASPIILSKD